MTTRRRVIGALALACAGCAREPDWIESTLVTVDVSGAWAGTLVQIGGTFELTLQQAGQKVTGELRYSGWNAGQFPSGAVSGMVTGDVLRLETTSGARRFSFRVDGDVMRGAGSGVPFAGGPIELRRRKP